MIRNNKSSKNQKTPKDSEIKTNSSKNITITLEEFNELKRRNAELEKEKLSAEEANFLKSQFLASMTHELKSPLGAIFNYTQYLKKIHNEQEEFIFKHIELCKNQLIDTVKKLIDISQLHINKFPYHPEICNIPKILSDTILTIEILALQKGLAFTLNCEEADIYSNVDPYAISHAFLNILDNAIKYTEEEKGHIDIRLTRDKSGNINIEFTDKGIGISSERLENIFDEFSTDHTSFIRKADGTGIGMPLTKKLVEACNGSIKAESVEKQGTKITIILPELKSKKSNKKSYQEIMNPEPPNFTGLVNILVLERDAIVQQFLQMNLKNRNYNVYKALTKEQIFLILNDYKIDLIIANISLISEDDSKVLKKIRKGKNSKSIPIIGLTEAKYIEENKELIETLNSFVIQPVNITELTGRIDMLINK